MNKLLSCLIIVCLSSILDTANAQQQPVEGEKAPTVLNTKSYKYFAGKETATMTGRLKLDKKQEEEIGKLNDSYYLQAASLLQDRQQAPAIRKSKLEALRAGRNESLEKLLSKEQYATYTTDMAQAKARAEENVKRMNDALKAKQEKLRKGKPDSITTGKSKI